MEVTLRRRCFGRRIGREPQGHLDAVTTSDGQAGGAGIGGGYRGSGSGIAINGGTVEVTEKPYTVRWGEEVTVVYTADEGYEFPGGASTWTTNVTANAATVTVTIPAGERPVARARGTLFYLTMAKSLGAGLCGGAFCKGDARLPEYSTQVSPLTCVE